MDPQTNPRNVLSQFIREVAKGEENALEITQHALTELGPDGKPVEAGKCFVVAMQNRQLRPESPLAPERAESPRRAHRFHDVEGFARYIGKYKTERTVVLADITDETIYAVIDDQAAQGFEGVSMAPALHPLYDPWDELIGASVPLQPFAEFVMANRRVIADFEGRSTHSALSPGKEMALLFSQIRAATNITIQKGRGKKSVNGLMVETEIQAEVDRTPVDLPDTMTLECPIYVGTEPQLIEIDLLTSLKDQTQIVVSVSSAAVAELKVKAFQEMIAQLQHIDGITLAMGKPNHAPWDYLK